MDGAKVRLLAAQIGAMGGGMGGSSSSASSTLTLEQCKTYLCERIKAIKPKELTSLPTPTLHKLAQLLGFADATIERNRYHR